MAMELNESQQKVLTALSNLGTAAPKEIADDVELGYSTVTGILRQLHEGGLVKKIELEGEEAKDLGAKVAWQIIVPDKPKRQKAPRTATVGDGKRFGKGELRGLALGVLLTKVDEEWSPTQIAKQIAPDRVGNISGSIGHACDILVGTGHVVKTSDKPRRYQAANPQPATES